MSALFIFSKCEDNTEMFIADINSDVIAFQNTFANEYLLSKETQENIADRFIWNEVTNITTNQYELQASSTTDFASITVIGNTNTNNHIVLVKQLLTLANQLNLDDDPNTTGSDGNPNNSGVVYFRVKASIGNGGAGSDEIFSELAGVNIKIIEKTTNTTQCEGLWLVGNALVNAGWNFVISSNCDSNVNTVKVSLTNDVFRFFKVQGDWSSGLNFPYFIDNGYTIDSNFENDGSSDANFRFLGTPGIYTLIVDENDKKIELIPSSSLWAVGGAVPGGWGFNANTIEFKETNPDVWTASITLSNGNFRFFKTFGTWDINNNMTYYEDQGFTIDSNFENDGSGDGNFKFIGTPGTYTMTINAKDKTITLN